MNGTINRKSRYFTINAAIQTPAPRDAAKTSNTKNGSSTTPGGGITLYQIIIPARNTLEIRKSTRLVITVLAVIVSRGKYTLEIMFEFDTRLLPLSMIAVEKKSHGSMPQN